jgi:isopentenyl-diphosphate delta-isomerase
MGLTINKLTKFFDFIYKAKLDNGLSEYEFDHVFAGITDDLPIPESTEVSDFEFVDADTLLRQICKFPNNYSVWFKKIIERVFADFHLYKHNL